MSEGKDLNPTAGIILVCDYLTRVSGQFATSERGEDFRGRGAGFVR